MAELNLEYGLRKISFDPLLNYWHFQDLVEIRSRFYSDVKHLFDQISKLL